MDEDVTEDLKRLKKQFLEAEQASRNEKDCLLKLVNTFGIVVSEQEELAEEYHAIKELIKNGKALPLEPIREATGKLRGKIFAKETEAKPVESDPGQLKQNTLLRACRNVRKIVGVFADGFYPVTGKLKEEVDAIPLDCREEITPVELDEATDAFLGFLKGLKGKISGDFKYINNSFVMLLEPVKELEKTLTSEFSESVRQREIEHFESSVNSEVGDIVNSFDIQATIEEIKSTVIGKIENIKRIVAKRRQEEIKKSQRTQKHIDKLKKKIDKAEVDLRKIAEKAEHFEIVAKKDGLTGLYNRQAFDRRLQEALKGLEEGGETFSIVIFDVDKFKWINDNLGHVAGDKVLQSVAENLKETFRKNDFIARYGGDEFAVVVEGMSEDMARERILKFSKSFSKHRFVSHAMSKEISVSLSAGVAEAFTGEAMNDLIHRADMAMYTLKKEKS